METLPFLIGLILFLVMFYNTIKTFILMFRFLIKNLTINKINILKIIK